MTGLRLVARRSPAGPWIWTVCDGPEVRFTLTCHRTPRGGTVPAGVRDQLAQHGLVAVFVAMGLWRLQPVPAAPEAA